MFQCFLRSIKVCLHLAFLPGGSPEANIWAGQTGPLTSIELQISTRERHCQLQAIKSISKDG